MDSIIKCKDCIHRPKQEDGDLIFPDWKCPFRCPDDYYSTMPKDNFFCANGEKASK